MSQRITIASLLAAIVLSLLTVLAYRTPRASGGSGGGGRVEAGSGHGLVGLDATEVRSVRTPSAHFEWTDGGWLGSWASAPDQRWPAETAQVRGIVRLATEIARQPVVPAGEAGVVDGPTLALGVDAQREVLMRFARQALGGGTLCVEQTPSGERVVRRAVGDWPALLSAASVEAWRSRGVVSAAGLDNVQDVSITSGERELRLVRRGATWMMEAPVVAHAEASEVAALLAAMGALRAERFVDGATQGAIADSFARPLAVVRVRSQIVGTEVRSGSGGETSIPARGGVGGEMLTTLEHSLRVGGAADASGTMFFVQASAMRDGVALWGPGAVVLSRSAVESLARDASAYVTRRSVQFAGTDVARIEFAPAAQGTAATALERRRDGWSVVGRGDAPAGVAGLVALLCDTSASAVVLDESTLAPELLATFQHLAWVTLRGREGSGVETCEIGVMRRGETNGGTNQGGPARQILAVRTGHGREGGTVLRLYEARSAGGAGSGGAGGNPPTGPDSVIAPLIPLLEGLVKGS